RHRRAARRDRRSDLRGRVPGAGLRRCRPVHRRRLAGPHQRQTHTPPPAHLRSLGPSAGDAGQARSVLSGVPRTLPSLLRAYEIGTRVAAVGFDWARTIDVVDKIEEEVQELRQAVASEGQARTEEEMGDLLFSIANLSRKLGIDPESALRKANEKFTKRFTALEDNLHAQGRSVHGATLEEMEREWTAVKSGGSH